MAKRLPRVRKRKKKYGSTNFSQEKIFASQNFKGEIIKEQKNKVWLKSGSEEQNKYGLGNIIILF